MEIGGYYQPNDQLASEAMRPSETLNQYREMRFENNYMSNNAPELHFGLAGDNAVSELRVEWPDGEVTIVSDVPANQFMVIEHPSYND